MYAITGATGQVGGHVVRQLRAAGVPVRVVIRNAAKAAQWQAQGCEVALAAMDDAAALRQAFLGAEAVFVLLPPTFDPAPGYPQAQAEVAALLYALRGAAPQRVVCLSTIGAQATQENLLSQLGFMEQAFAALPMPVGFVRAAWFMENSAYDIDSARRLGVLSSFLQPLDKPVPMVATADVGQAAAQMLQETWAGRRTLELEGPVRVTPHELAVALGRALQRPVEAQAVPRATWDALFRSQGMQNPGPRIRMIDGFNEGWIEFEQGAAASRKGTTSLDTVIAALVAQASA